MSSRVDGLDITLKKLSNLSQIAKEKTLLKIAMAAKNEIILNFENERTSSKSAWEKLKPATIKEKQRRGLRDGILKRTGKLSKASFWNVSMQSKNVAIVSNNASGKNGFKYGLSHQFGAKGKNIPARPFLPIVRNKASEKLLKAIKMAIKEAVEES